MIQVRLFHIPCIQIAYIADQTVYNIKNSECRKKRTDKLAKIAASIRDQIQACREKDIPLKICQFSEKLVNDMAAMHADTWIEGVGLHTVEYSTTITTNRPDLEIFDEVNHRSVRNRKRISGDVSGVIGETLFSVVLHKCYQMKDDDYSHLIKPNTMRYPDFGIVKPSTLFENEMRTQGVLSYYLDNKITIPCEVKTFSNFDRPLDRIRDAADQLISFWYNKKQTKGVGLICIPILNTINGSYDLFFVWCY